MIGFRQGGHAIAERNFFIEESYFLSRFQKAKVRTKSINPIWLIGIAALWLGGCAPAGKMTGTSTPPPPAQSNTAPPEKTVACQAVEGFTGKTAVGAGERTKAKIKGINAQRRQDFE